MNSEFWAKTTAEGLPGISVRDHCLNVGCVAEAIMKRSSFAFLDHRLAVWLAACHDIGKISPGFQQKCQRWVIDQGLESEVNSHSWRTSERDHSKVSQFTLQYLFHEQFRLSMDVSGLWASCAGMHHGAPHWKGQFNGLPQGIQKDDAWESARRSLVSELNSNFGSPPLVPPVDPDDLSSLFWTAGLISVSDWIGSDENHFSSNRNQSPMGLTVSRKAADLAVEEIGFRIPNLAKDLSFKQLFEEEPYDLQTAALEMITEPGVYVIEAPMGMGKTEAALAVAYKLITEKKATGLYFSLPTQATSNRIHERVARFLHRAGSEAPRLIHGGSWLIDKALKFPNFESGLSSDQKLTARDWFASSKRALIAPFGVGTVDQALLGVIAVKHFFVRHFALAGKVVVLDEVHSYDVFTGTHIDALIAMLLKLRCTVIILSATLTKERREHLLTGKAVSRSTRAPAANAQIPDPFPLISGVLSTGARLAPRPISPPKKQPATLIKFFPEEAILEKAVKAARAGACVLWICNTVDKASAIYASLIAERREGDPQVGLLHSRFPYFRRQELENEWMTKLGKDRSKRPRGCILVSTQIVEQSVDLDSDLLITELAPTDMLFQRLGRLWRHPRPKDEPRAVKRPEIWIVSESFSLDAFHQMEKREMVKALGKKAKVYSPYVLLRTLEQWRHQSKINLPQDIRPWLEATYAKRDENNRPSWKQLLSELDQQKKELIGRADAAQNCWSLPVLKDEEGAHTRLNDCPTIHLVLLKSVGESDFICWDGTQLSFQCRWFDYETAKALHRNTVKVPAWWFSDKARLLKSVPQQVANVARLYLNEPFEVARVHEGSIQTDGMGLSCGLDYNDNCGVSRQAAPPKHKTDPLYDDDHFED